MNDQMPLDVGLRDHASFGNFHVGPHAQLVAALQQTATAQGDRYVYLSGGAHHGKSHLLQACAHLAEQTGLRHMYLALSTTELNPGVLADIEQFNLLCIDQIEVIAGHSDWEEAVFDLFNRIHENNGHLIIAGCRRPTDIGITLADLSSRLSSGALYQLRELNDTDKRLALQLRAHQRGLVLPDDTAEYLLRRCPRDTAYLFALLGRLDTAALVSQRRLTIPFIKTVLVDPAGQ